jgi:hypothetical protein
MPVSSGTSARGHCREIAQRVRQGAVIAFVAGKAQRLLQHAVGLIESVGADQARPPYIDALFHLQVPALRLKFHGSVTEPEVKASPRLGDTADRFADLPMRVRRMRAAFVAGRVAFFRFRPRSARIRF